MRIIRRLIFCSRGIHSRPKYNDGTMHGICSGGHCEDCGESWGPLDTPPMPKCKPPKPEGPEVAKNRPEHQWLSQQADIDGSKADVDFGRVLDDISIIVGIDITGHGRSIADIKEGAE